MCCLGHLFVANEEVHARFLLNILLKSCVKPTHETDPVIPNSESKGSQRSVIKAFFKVEHYLELLERHSANLRLFPARVLGMEWWIPSFCLLAIFGHNVTVRDWCWDASICTHGGVFSVPYMVVVQETLLCNSVHLNGVSNYHLVFPQ